MVEENGWSQYSKLVLAELAKADSRLGQIERCISDIRVSVEKLTNISERQKDLEDRLQELEIEMSAQKVRTSMWGAFAGTAASAAIYLIQRVILHG